MRDAGRERERGGGEEKTGWREGEIEWSCVACVGGRR